MFKVINKQIVADQTKRIDVEAELVARKALPGQFVVVMPDEKSSRIALPITETDPSKGMISLVFEEKTSGTKRLGAIPIGESLGAVLGPLGVPMELAEVRKSTSVVCLGYGIGIAYILPVARALRKAGHKVIGIVGAKTKKALPLESQMRLACDRILITTDDGTHEQKGFVTGSLKEILADSRVQAVYGIAPIEIMQAVCQMTRREKIKTRVSLNPVMVDGTGLCGSCRVKVGGKDVLACIDGPSFDGHRVDFEDLKMRTKYCPEKTQCYDHKFQHNFQKNGSATLTKLLGGLRKSKP